MNRKTVAVIISVIVTISSSLFFFMRFDDETSDTDVITEPKISEQQAIDIVSTDLRNRFPEFEETELKLFHDERGYIKLKEFTDSDAHLPLKYFHPNGTQFNVNASDGSIVKSCEPEICALTDLDSKADGRLVYTVDLTCPQCTSEIYVVDAVNGNIVYSTAALYPQNSTALAEPADRQQIVEFIS